MYFFINQTKTWHEAQAYCRLYHHDLGKVLTLTDSNEILKVVPIQTLTLFGLYRGTWQWWSDGTTHIFDYWVQGHPQGWSTGSCAASLIDATNAGRLSEYDCGTQFPFMCYGRESFYSALFLLLFKEPRDILDAPRFCFSPASKEPPRRYVRRIKLAAQKSTSDLNDPAVTGAILTQVSVEHWFY